MLYGKTTTDGLSATSQTTVSEAELAPADALVRWRLSAVAAQSRDDPRRGDRREPCCCTSQRILEQSHDSTAILTHISQPASYHRSLGSGNALKPDAPTLSDDPAWRGWSEFSGLSRHSIDLRPDVP